VSVPEKALMRKDFLGSAQTGDVLLLCERPGALAVDRSTGSVNVLAPAQAIRVGLR
jgi:hypothetical protein